MCARLWHCEACHIVLCWQVTGYFVAFTWVRDCCWGVGRSGETGELLRDPCSNSLKVYFWQVQGAVTNVLRRLLAGPLRDSRVVFITVLRIISRCAASLRTPPRRGCRSSLRHVLNSKTISCTTASGINRTNVSNLRCLCYNNMHAIVISLIIKDNIHFFFLLRNKFINRTTKRRFIKWWYMSTYIHMYIPYTHAYYMDFERSLCVT